MRIVLIHPCIEHILLFVCKGRAFRFERIQNHLRLDLLFIIVRKRKPGGGEMQAVPVLVSGNLLQPRYVPVGDIVHSLHILHKLVTVPDYHQLVPPDKPFLLELHGRADPGIVPVRPAVGPAQDNGLILPVLRICIRNLFQQFPS